MNFTDSDFVDNWLMVDHNGKIAFGFLEYNTKEKFQWIEENVNSVGIYFVWMKYGNDTDTLPVQKRLKM